MGSNLKDNLTKKELQALVKELTPDHCSGVIWITDGVNMNRLVKKLNRMSK